MSHPPFGSPTLVLVPTDLELARLRDLGGFPVGLALVERCGFGPVAAAARTATLLERLRPRQVVLLGIAGSFDVERFPVGSALEFDACAIEGIGVGEGASLIPPPALGFPQWPGAEGGRAPIFDRVPLARAKRSTAFTLLTTCAASADAAQAHRRRERCPDAVAEDMEGFAVAAACAMAGTPLRIVRGLSNQVGDRDAARWRIPAALGAARAAALELLESGEGWA
jgi:futalosine hydrolase